MAIEIFSLFHCISYLDFGVVLVLIPILRSKENATLTILDLVPVQLLSNAVINDNKLRSVL